MSFNSLSFLVFVPVVYLIFYFSRERWRWLVLLVASYGFYAALKAPYLLAVLLTVTCISYTCGCAMSDHQDDSIRLRWFRAGAVACIAILAVLKYLPFAAKGPLSPAIITIGVSYFTFQAISYLADVFLEIEDAERHFGYFALYLAFFPKLLQGPIERAGYLIPQLRKGYQFDYDAIRSGFLLLGWGLFKKVAVAERLAFYADEAFNHLDHYSGPSLLVGLYLYAFQLYFDFSAYTDMARGVASIFGIRLTENFNTPYLATSVADFWRRWHISFSRCLLDYLFKPLQMGWRDWGQAGTALALLVTFLVSGIWHGASWNFVLWGALHGIYLAASTYYKPLQRKWHQALGVKNSWVLKSWQVLITFHLVSFAWIFFRTETLSQATSFLTRLFIWNDHNLGQLLSLHSPGQIAVSLMLVAVPGVVSLLKKRVDFLHGPLWMRWASYYALGLMILVFKQPSGGFIYSRF